MKTGRTVALAAIVCTARALNVATVPGFGPANCVSVSRSSSGSCVLHTKCAGQDLSSFDMSFDCVVQSDQKTHSLGVGSFDVQEEYDTDLKCDTCLPPSTGKAVVKHTKATGGVSLAAISVKRVVAKVHDSPEDDTDSEGESEPKAEWYGPDECVGVWRDGKTGQCVMQTDCNQETQISVYEFGLVCVDQNDEMTRHIFGMGSFGHKETFNTLIKCEQCLALDEYMDGDKALNKLTKMVQGMKTDLKNVTSDISKLNSEVFKPKPPASAPAAPPAPAPAPAAANTTADAPAATTAAPSAFLASHREAAASAQVVKVIDTAAQTQDSQLGKDVASVSENGKEVQHVKVKASQASQQRQQNDEEEVVIEKQVSESDEEPEDQQDD